jgi:serine/threonine-protein kinase
MATCPTCRTHYDDATVVCAKDGAKLLPDAAFTSADVDLKEGHPVGEYQVEVKLGEGGFGSVYRAKHPLIGKTAAVKVLAREFSAKPEIVARFIDEARAVNQIRHKGIVDIFSFGTLQDGRHYFVMELLEGASLDAYLRERGRIPVGETITILRSVARAVDAAHQAGIAHRDLKPDNVFLVNEDDGTARTKLLDFGVAKLLSEQSGRTRTGTPIGTPQYMSPEQARGVNVDTRTDVYSFGAMAYEMITGRVPFEGVTIMDTLMKQISEEPVPPSKVCPDLPEALDAPILHMLDKDAEKRPQTLLAAIEELASAANAAGIPAAPTSSVSVGRPVDTSARTVPATPPISAAISGSVPTSVPAASGKSLIGSSADAAAPLPKKRNIAWVAVPIALAVVAGTYFGVQAMRDKHTTPAATASVAPTTSATVTPSVTAMKSAEPAEQVSITIDTLAPNAQVFDGNTLLGNAPGPFKLPKRAGKTKLTVKAPGFTTKDVDVDTSADGLVPVALLVKARVTTTTTTAAPSSSHINSDLIDGYH